MDLESESRLRHQQPARHALEFVNERLVCDCGPPQQRCLVVEGHSSRDPTHWPASLCSGVFWELEIPRTALLTLNCPELGRDFLISRTTAHDQRQMRDPRAGRGAVTKGFRTATGQASSATWPLGATGILPVPVGEPVFRYGGGSVSAFWVKGSPRENTPSPSCR